MPPLGSRTKPGKRHTRPQPRVVDIRDGSRHGAGLIDEIRRSATAAQLSLGGQEHRPAPADLATVSYSCDRDDLTAFGGIPLFARFAYELGLSDLCDIPFPKRESVYSPRKLCETVVMILAAGLSRVSHVDHYTYDPGLCRSLGLERLPDQGQLSRFFTNADEASVDHLRAANRRLAKAATVTVERHERLVVDSDTRDVGVYGKQQGTVRNRRNDGDPYLTFEATTLRNSYDILDGGLLKGATHPVPLFEQRFRTVLEQVASQTKELIWCADAAWYSAAVCQDVEAADADPCVPCACRYAIRVQSNKYHEAAIARIDEASWRPCADGIEIAEYQYAFSASRHKDTKSRRHIVTRKLIVGKRSKDQAVLVDVPAYEYAAIVTNLTWKPKLIWALYNDRATIESILREGALGFHMDSLPTGGLLGNQLFCQLLVLAYNLVNLFRRLCLPKEHCRHHVQTLRQMFLRIPALVEPTAKALVLHCATHGPHRQLLSFITQRLEHWLANSAPQPV